MSEFCKDCVYWHDPKGDEGRRVAQCRRYPPVQRQEPNAETLRRFPIVAGHAAKHPWSWPLTEEDDWCGEFRDALQ